MKAQARNPYLGFSLGDPENALRIAYGKELIKKKTTLVDKIRSKEYLDKMYSRLNKSMGIRKEAAFYDELEKIAVAMPLQMKIRLAKQYRAALSQMSGDQLVDLYKMQHDKNHKRR